MGEVSHGSKGNEELNGPTLVVIGVRENDRSGESWSFAEEDSNFSCRLHLALLFWNQTCTGRKEGFVRDWEWQVLLRKIFG